jgi:ribosomal protein L21
MKYIIASLSGKQFFLRSNEWYDIDYVKKSDQGDLLCLQKLLFYKKDKQLQFGQPFLDTSVLGVEIIQQKIKGKKITVLKTKPKKHYTRVKGHRTIYTRIRIPTF